MAAHSYFRACVLLLIGNFALIAEQPSSNWSAGFEPCERSSELLKSDQMDLGIWLNTGNRLLNAEFRRAMNFWADILDLTWHEEDTRNCSIQVVFGSPILFGGDNITAARSQFTDKANFHGWIALNPRCRLTPDDAFLMAVHEIGHMLGLRHSESPRSVMYFLNPTSPPTLDEDDFAVLALRHKLRGGF